MAQVPPDLDTLELTSEGGLTDTGDPIQIEANLPAQSGDAIVPTPADWASMAYAVHADFGGDVGGGKIPVSALSWEEQSGELATRITLQFPDYPSHDSAETGILPPPTSPPK